MTRRTTGAAGSALALSAALLLAACGGGSATDDEPKAAPTEVATDIAPPKPTSAQTFAGQSLSEADTTRLTTTMTSALRTGNKKLFLSSFDPRDQALVTQQGTWFDNVRRVPMKDRTMVLVEATDNRDSSGKGKLAADMGFQHQIAGADSAPLAEWYRFTFTKAGKKLLVTGVTGAPADKSSGEKYSRYYRQPWDDKQMAVVEGRKSIFLGPEADTSAMRRLAGTADAAIDAQIQRFTRAKARLAPDVRTRKWVFMLQSPDVADVFDYLGGYVKPTEADFEGYASRVFLSDPKTGFVDPTNSGEHRSRIVLARAATTDPEIGTTIRHEMTHALESTWQEGYGDAPRWAVEGSAVTLSDASAAERSDLKSAGTGYVRSHSALPTDSVFYEGGNEEVRSHYGAGYLACAYVAATQGEPALLRMLRGLDDQKSLEKLIGMSQSQLTRKALAWAS